MVEPPAEPAWDDALTARLDRWLADAQVDGAADARARERWLQAAADADATFSGVLLDLAERATPIAVGLAGGRRHHGAIEVLGADFVALRLGSGTEVLLALAAVTGVRTSPRAHAASGERVVTTELRLTEVLAALASERARALVIATGGADSVAGELRSVGQDVLTLRVDGDPSTAAHLPLAAVAEVVLG